MRRLPEDQHNRVARMNTPLNTLVMPRTGWVLLLVALLLAAPVGSPEAAETGGNASLEMVPEWVKPSDYTYSPIGKPDPFKSFVRAAPAAPAARQEQPQRPLTPLERIDVTQLQLVGILWYPEDPDKVMAMVRLPDGKGFVLRKGSRVGQNNGQVVAISSDEVVVREDYTTIFGKQETRYKTLKLYHGSGEGQ